MRVDIRELGIMVKQMIIQFFYLLMSDFHNKFFFGSRQIAGGLICQRNYSFLC